MSRASRIAIIASALVIASARPAYVANMAPAASLFDRLLSEYTAGRYDVVAETIKARTDLVALQPELNTALTTWTNGVTPMRALFLLEIAAVTADRKWVVPPVKGTPPFFEQVGLVWMRSWPLGSSPRNDAFTVAFDKALMAIAERTVVDSPKALDDFVDMIQERFDRSPLVTPTHRMLDARFPLARAMAAELVTLRPRSPYGPHEMNDSEVTSRFKKAMIAPDALPETFVRGACAWLRAGVPKDALAAIDRFKDPQDDPALTYWAWLLRGRALAAMDRATEADAAYRKALEVSPHAQSAEAALTSLFMFWNNPTEAQRWSAAITGAPADSIDPWWFYAQGDYRFMHTWLAALRKAAE